MSQNINNIKNLFNTGVDDEEITQQTSQILINGLDDTNIAGYMGTDLDDIESDDVILVKLVLDRSWSMKDYENEVRTSYDALIDALKESKQAKNMLVSTHLFAGPDDSVILHGFQKVEEIDKIGRQYIAEGGSTAIYYNLRTALAGTYAYAKDLNDNGVRTKNLVCILSDGDDNSSRPANPAATSQEIQTISADYLRQENWILSYIGFGPDNHDSITAKIGFPNVLTAQQTASEIRKSMGLLSASIIRASQTQIGSNNSFFS